MLTESQSQCTRLDHSTRLKVNTCGKYPIFAHHIACFWVFTDQTFNSFGHITLPTLIDHCQTWLKTIYLLDKKYKRVHEIKGYWQPSLNLLLKKKIHDHFEHSTTPKKKKKTLFSKGMRNNDTRGPTQLNSNRCMSLNEEDAECLRYFSNFPIHTSMLFSSFTFFLNHLAHWKTKGEKKKMKERTVMDSSILLTDASLKFLRNEYTRK